MTEPLYILDGHSQIFRAYWAKAPDLTSPTGEPTRATYVFCSMLLKFIADRRPAYLAMAVDGPAEKLRRRQRYDQYKITRKPTPEDFHPQAERIIEIVRAMGIPVLAAEGYEADDILATAAEKFASDDLRWRPATPRPRCRSCWSAATRTWSSSSARTWCCTT